MAAIQYTALNREAWKKQINLHTGGDTIKACLVTSSYTPDVDHDTYSDVSSYEVSNGNGYTTGGLTVTGQAVTEDAASNEVRWSCDDPTWAALTKTGIRSIVFYDDTTATKHLLFCDTFGADQSCSGGSFVVDVPATGYCVSTQP